MFVTLIYAIVDSSIDEIVIARAGHELPIHGHYDTKDGLYKTTMIGSEGMALGMVEPELFESVIADKKISFVKGDTLLLYTDGITEFANLDDIEFSTSRLVNLLNPLGNLSAIELNQGILDNVYRFAGSAGQNDDITLVTVKHL
jgi:sigma-B regulation protein RsbU (phosphoserine phosphatase)